jgi:hypothetical protein
MKTLRLQAEGLSLNRLLHQSEDRLVLLTADGEERFALVPVEPGKRDLPGPDEERTEWLRKVERWARGRLSGTLAWPDRMERLSSQRTVFHLDSEKWKLLELLEVAEDDTAVFLTEEGRIRLVLLWLGNAGALDAEPEEVGVMSAPKRAARPMREPREEYEPPRSRHWDRDERPRTDRPRDQGLSSNEWLLFSLLFLVIPAANVMVSSVLYYLWRSSQPRRANQINAIGFIVFGVHALLGCFLWIGLLAFSDVVATSQGPPPPPNNKTGPASGLLAYWSFDEGQGDQAANTGSPNAEFAVLRGAKWIDGKRGKAVEFDGVSAYCELDRRQS